MKTVTTKILPPTNYNGTRIVATDGDNRIVLPADYSLTSEEEHVRAARTLRDKLEWKYEMMGGHTKDGMVFVMLHGASPVINL